MNAPMNSAEARSAVQLLVQGHVRVADALHFDNLDQITAVAIVLRDAINGTNRSNMSVLACTCKPEVRCRPCHVRKNAEELAYNLAFLAEHGAVS